MNIKTTAELRKMLLETIEAVKTGGMKPQDAAAIANLSSKILQSAKLDLEILKYNSMEGRVEKAGEKVLQLING